jgi:hypothetical protein
LNINASSSAIAALFNRLNRILLSINASSTAIAALFNRLKWILLSMNAYSTAIAALFNRVKWVLLNINASSSAIAALFNRLNRILLNINASSTAIAALLNKLYTCNNTNKLSHTESISGVRELQFAYPTWQYRDVAFTECGMLLHLNPYIPTFATINGNRSDV